MSGLKPCDWIVATGWLPSPTSNREDRPSFAASIAAGPDAGLEPPEVPELAGALEPLGLPELAEPLEAPELPGALEPLAVPEPLELPEVPEVPEVPELLEPPVVLPVCPAESALLALVIGMAEEPAPPQAASASATRQQGALISATRSFIEGTSGEYE